MISDKVSCAKKVSRYFIGYKDHDKIRPLCKMLPKISGYFKCFDEASSMSFLI